MTILENIKLELEKIIGKEILEDIGNMKFDVSFIDEVNAKYGDVSTNVALILSKRLNVNLLEIGESLRQTIQDSIDIQGPLATMIKSLNFTKNGFINFFLKEEFLISEVERVSNLKFIETKYTDKKVLVEHSSPNLFKPFHIGHLMNNIIGDSVVHMMKATKSDLRVMSFPSDISMGIAKAIYVLKHKRNWSFFNEDIIKTLGDAYVEGVKIYNENPDTHEEIKLIASNLFERNEETEDYQIFEKAKKVNIEYFEKILDILGSKFDHLIYESEAGVRGEHIVKNNLNKVEGKEVFEIGEGGAVVFDTKKIKNKDSSETIKSVFINSEGYPTYEAKDLGLLDLKHLYFPFDHNFFVTDNEQAPHFEVVLAAAKELGGELEIAADKSQHIPHGRLNLKGERMSSRLGNILTAEETLNLVNKKVEERLSEKSESLTEIEKEDLIKKISLSALRIAILKSKPGLNIDFDLENSLAFEGATGPYLLYTYARANSILEKTENKNFANLNINENSLPLFKKIIQFESVAKKGIEDIAPQSIVKYLFELSQAFNTFYAKEKIISDDKEKTDSNLALLSHFLKTFKFAMNMIGIEEVERM